MLNTLYNGWIYNGDVIDSKQTLESKCAVEYNSIRNNGFVNGSPLITEQIEYVPDRPDISQHDILVATWNVNTHALTAKDLQYFFSKKLDWIQSKIFVLALQEIENSNFNFYSIKSRAVCFGHRMWRTQLAAEYFPATECGSQFGRIKTLILTS